MGAGVKSWAPKAWQPGAWKAGAWLAGMVPLPQPVNAPGAGFLAKNRVDRKRPQDDEALFLMVLL